MQKWGVIRISWNGLLTLAKVFADFAANSEEPFARVGMFVVSSRGFVEESVRFRKLA